MENIRFYDFGAFLNISLIVIVAVAIVAAGAITTKNVPCTIVGGNLTRSLKKKVDNELIVKLLQIK